MTLRDVITSVRFIRCATMHHVERTIADDVRARFAPQARLINADELPDACLLTLNASSVAFERNEGSPARGVCRVNERKCIQLEASHPSMLYALYSCAMEDWSSRNAESFRDGIEIEAKFAHFRPVYDVFLNQHARMAHGFKREDYFRQLARCGFTHAEINGLAFDDPIEAGPPGEVYSRFYTYCPSLDQFVTSALNRGFIDGNYIEANMSRLRTNAENAERYGLRCGLVSFEPRSVPDALLDKYPTLRGARVDHPLRSFKPRYNLSVAHPIVREHYAEMIASIVRAVPTIDYLSIWSNDSGAGFEYTHSLYVGRNGGGYIIREWKNHDEIARTAAESMIEFLRLLRDAGRSINPAFRVLLRLEPFWAEHEHLWRRLEEGIDVEVSSLLMKGWSLAYHHPRYSEVPEVHGTALFNRFDAKEKPLIEELASKRVATDVYITPQVLWNHEPLIGIPFPKLVHEKLSDLCAVGVDHVCTLGGIAPEEFAPFDINRELVRRFQLGGAGDLDEFLFEKAIEWIGDDDAASLRDWWQRADDVVRAFPVPVWIYSGWGVWYRLLVRPLVPDIDAIEEAERDYYERHLLAPPHNRTRIDLRYDVGFELITPHHAKWAIEKFDTELFPRLDALLADIDAFIKRKGECPPCARDLFDRLTALRLWYRNQRNVTAWIAFVHGWLAAESDTERSACRASLREMMLDEIENTGALHSLWTKASTHWMIYAGEYESTFIYNKNFGELLGKKIELMRRHLDDEPRIDPDFQWRPYVTPHEHAA